MAEAGKNRAPSRAPKKISAPRSARADAVELSLSIAKEGLGLSLGAPVRLGPIEVLDLALLLPGLKFPLDVSGGVARFRHRRGELERLTLSLSYDALSAFARERLAGVIGPRPPEITVGEKSGVLTIALTDPDDLRALAFDLVPKSRGRAVVIVMSRARGAFLPAPATALALSAFARLVSEHARLDGAIATFDDLSDVIARAVLPDAGARVPSASQLQSVQFAWSSLGLIVRLKTDPDPHDASARAALDVEIATTTREADKALATREWSKARKLLLSLLSRAPRAPELCQRIAEIDAHDRDRAESALATLADADPLRPLLAGTLKGELLARAGRVEDAIAALLDGSELETATAVAAAMLALAATLRDEPHDALAWLDRAVARAPHLETIRKKRLAAALRSSRMDIARADAGALEAQATTPQEKHDVLVDTARAFQEAGVWPESRALLERALRYRPDSALALARLGIALVTEGRTARGAALLSDAVEREPFPDAILALASALATLGDRPSAIARLSSLGPDSSAFVTARAMEATLRQELSDPAGASLAYARIREHALARNLAEAADVLAAAETFERQMRHDDLAADRHAAARRKLLPRGAASASHPAAAPLVPAPAQPPPAPTATAQTHVAPRAPAVQPPDPPSVPSGAVTIVGGDEDPSARAEKLKDALRAAPNDVDTVVELAGLLAELGETHDLVALVFACKDEGNLARTGHALGAALDRAEKMARVQGRNADAALLVDAKKLALG